MGKTDSAIMTVLNTYGHAERISRTDGHYTYRITFNENAYDLSDLQTFLDALDPLADVTVKPVPPSSWDLIIPEEEVTIHSDGAFDDRV